MIVQYIYTFIYGSFVCLYICPINIRKTEKSININLFNKNQPMEKNTFKLLY